MSDDEGVVVAEKPKRTRKRKADPPAEDGQPQLATIARCASYGIKLTAEQINSWDGLGQEVLRTFLDQCDERLASEHDPIEVPEWLLVWDAPTTEEQDVARSEGKGWRGANPEGEAAKACPYPGALRLGIAWLEGAAPAVPAEVQSESEKAAEPAPAAEPVKSTPEPAAAVQVETPAKPARKAAERFTCTKREREILKLVDRLGDVSPQCDAAELDFRTKQASANQAKKAWEALQEQMAGVCTQITAIKNGADIQPDLFDKADRPAEPIQEPHPAVHQEGGGSKPPEKLAPAAAVPSPRDEGGELDLMCLTTKELVKLCGTEWSEYGLTESKVELLKSACEGSTIAHLEKMQRENPNWNRDIKGFGEKWIDRLQDAHLAIRTKFPMPTEDVARDEPEAQDDSKAVETAANATDAKPGAVASKSDAQPDAQQTTNETTDTTDTTGTVLDGNTEAAPASD